MITADDICLRPWRTSDRDGLVALADNPRVSANLPDFFPPPCNADDAEAWLAVAVVSDPGVFAIEVEGVLVGAVGGNRLADVQRYTAEVGYWLGVEHWGHGIATRSLRVFTDWLLEETDLQRLQACVYEWNPASGRVLEKADYVLESVQRRAVFKRGRFGDVSMYVRLRSG